MTPSDNNDETYELLRATEGARHLIEALCFKCRALRFFDIATTLANVIAIVESIERELDANLFGKGDTK
jgi:hypothetical protein